MFKYTKYIVLFSFFSTLLYGSPQEGETSKCIYCNELSCSDLGFIDSELDKEYCNTLHETDTYVFTSTLVAPRNKCFVYKFSAIWCGPCQVLAPYVDKIKGSFPDTKFSDHDVDKISDEFKKKYNVKSIPKIIAWVLGDDGKYKTIFNQTGLSDGKDIKEKAENTAKALEKALKDAGCGPLKAGLDDVTYDTDTYDTYEEYTYDKDDEVDTYDVYVSTSGYDDANSSELY